MRISDSIKINCFSLICSLIELKIESENRSKYLKCKINSCLKKSGYNCFRKTASAQQEEQKQINSFTSLQRQTVTLKETNSKVESVLIR